MKSTLILRSLILAGMLAFSTLPVMAVQPDEVLSNQKMEARARHLSTQLRCMVCQNQSIDDSDAPLAKDLRLLVRERLTTGETDAQVLDYLHERYGDFVLLNPPFKTATLLLWLSPLVILSLGGLMLWRMMRRRAGSGGGTPSLSDAERKQIDLLLKD